MRQVFICQENEKNRLIEKSGERCGLECLLSVFRVGYSHEYPGLRKERVSEFQCSTADTLLYVAQRQGSAAILRHG